MSKLKNEEIDSIFNIYKDIRSIAKTAEITGFSKITVNKYVRELSSTDKRSRDCKNPIKQIDLKTGKTIKNWTKPAHASKELKINLAEIVRVAKGELKQAGGFGWKYSNSK